MENFITYERAIEMIQQAAPSACTEKVSVRQAAGRILAEPVFSPISQPPFHRSPLDGYAFHAEDSKGASKDTPVVLQVVDTIYAGEWCDKTIEHGQAVRLMTGAPIPAGCDCVLRYEDTDNGRDSVQLYVELKPWSNYCFAGEDFQAGAELLPAGTRLTGIALGALAAAGLDRDDEYVTVLRDCLHRRRAGGKRCPPSSTRKNLLFQRNHPPRPHRGTGHGSPAGNRSRRG